MPTVKVDWVFRDLNRERSVGWTESLYLASAASAQDAIIPAVTLGRARVMMLGAGVKWTEIRASDVSIPGDSYVAPGDPWVTGSLYNPAWLSTLLGNVPPAVADFPWSAMLIRLTATAMYRRSYHLSGNPDFIQLDDYQKIVNPTWITFFDQWKNVLTSGGDQWCIKSRSKDPAIAWKTVTAFAPSTQQITVPNHGYVAGDEVRFRGNGWTPKLLGVAVVSPPISADTFWINRAIGAPSLNGLVQVRKVSYIYTRISGVTQRYYTQKKRGGISGAVRGRQRTR